MESKYLESNMHPQSQNAKSQKIVIVLASLTFKNWFQDRNWIEKALFPERNHV